MGTATARRSSARSPGSVQAGRRGGLYRAFDPYRGVVLGGLARRAGRFRVGRLCTLTVAFGQLELDLRAARLSQDEVTVTVMGAAARVSLIVPSTWR